MATCPVDFPGRDARVAANMLTIPGGRDRRPSGHRRRRSKRPTNSQAEGPQGEALWKAGRIGRRRPEPGLTEGENRRRFAARYGAGETGAVNLSGSATEGVRPCRYRHG